MTLEQEAFKMRGAQPGRTGGAPQRPTRGDWLARAVALVVLVGFLAAALMVFLLYAPVGFVVAVAFLFIALAHVASRQRELRRRVEALEAKQTAGPDPTLPVAEAPPRP